ncbi:hypothetical protein Sgou_61540 [Streptomyces gougerotii]|uniref:Uncharacterized protein n=1 Tax=Streptomyces gougerotii TaxID=53448 RepID=A0A8H9LU19_9ACTN|nr:hypothetical protein Sgou_61540 [Streptomyces gougerotii]GGU92227.1 hypothetical protein GCM10010227_54420 [Streptomyces gougerotii]
MAVKGPGTPHPGAIRPASRTTRHHVAGRKPGPLPRGTEPAALPGPLGTRQPPGSGADGTWCRPPRIVPVPKAAIAPGGRPDDARTGSGDDGDVRRVTLHGSSGEAKVRR